MSKVIKITDMKAAEDLAAWVLDEADIDDLAALYSKYLESKPVMVIGGLGDSDSFHNGKPFRKSSATTLQMNEVLLSALRALVDYDEGSNDPEDYGYELLQRCKAAIHQALGGKIDELG